MDSSWWTWLLARSGVAGTSTLPRKPISNTRRLPSRDEDREMVKSGVFRLMPNETDGTLQAVLQTYILFD